MPWTCDIADVDPDEELTARWFRDHDGAPALDPPHPEEQAREFVLDHGHWLPVRHAANFFCSELDHIKRRENDATPY